MALHALCSRAGYSEPAPYRAAGRPVVAMAQFAAFGRPVAAGEGGLEHAMADLRAEYERALRLNADGALDAAEQRYESILRHGLLGSDSADIPPSVRHLKALTLRNLGSLRVTVGRLPSGLNCLIRAAETEMGGWAGSYSVQLVASRADVS